MQPVFSMGVFIYILYSFVLTYLTSLPCLTYLSRVIHESNGGLPHGLALAPAQGWRRQ